VIIARGATDVHVSAERSIGGSQDAAAFLLCQLLDTFEVVGHVAVTLPKAISTFSPI
jgi:hypothetical protein